MRLEEAYYMTTKTELDLDGLNFEYYTLIWSFCAVFDIEIKSFSPVDLEDQPSYHIKYQVIIKSDEKCVFKKMR